MRKFLLLLSVLFVFGCESAKTDLPKEEIQEVLPILNDQAELKNIETVGVGAMCGGIAGLICKVGLTCKISAQHPDASGTCQELVTQKELICPTERIPVCGFKEGNKNGYLNECEAVRHGAVVLNKGFCKTDETVPGNCEAEFTTIGNCKTSLSGFVFNLEKNACTKKFASGCEAEVPFDSLENCQTACLK